MKFEIIAVGLSLFGLQAQCLQFFLRLAPLGIGRCIGCLFCGVGGHGVERVEQVVLAADEQVAVLRMYVDDQCAEFFEPRGWHGGVVDEGAAFACRRYLAAQNTFFAVEIYIVFVKKALYAERAHVERRFHYALCRTRPYGTRFGPSAEQYAECAKYDTFARARFARYYGKARLHADVEPVNQGIIIYRKAFEHAISFCANRSFAKDLFWKGFPKP